MRPASLSRAVFLFGAVFLVFLSVAASADAYLILFKDGFLLRGKIRQARTYISDKESRRAFSVPVSGALYSIETDARYFVFSPHQVHDVLEEKSGAGVPKWMNFSLFGRPRTTPMPSLFQIESVGDWNYSRWERTIKLVTDRGKFNVDQRITFFNPEVVQITSLTHAWVSYYRTKEFSPETVKKILQSMYGKQKERSPVEEKINIAKFMAQAGWPELAKADLENLLTESPDNRTIILEEIDNLTRLLTAEQMEKLERWVKIGRHGQAQQLIATFYKENWSARVDEKTQLRVFEIKSNEEKLAKQFAEAKKFLEDLPGQVDPKQRALFQESAKAILQELSLDNADRLQTFVDQARQYELADKEKMPQTNSLDKVLAFALTGWALGNGSAEANPELALKLWKARDYVLQYQRTPQAATRAILRRDYDKTINLPLDLLAKVIQLCPPPTPHPKLDGEIQELKVQLPTGEMEGNYLVQLPPEYTHNKPFPVLVVLHQSRETPEIMLRRWSQLASDNGYILVAPNWTTRGQTSYRFSHDENQVVLNVLRDIRQRFQVDNDRVFLFGADEGGFMSFDVGLAHPDQFAGVLPMSACPRFFALSYTANGQYLPFYVVSGEGDGKIPEFNNKVFKDWVRYHYPSVFVEYKGRAKDFFAAELPDMMDWMNRKKRAFPTKEMGAQSNSSRKSEEFATARQGDNRFYWLSTNSINPRNLNDVDKWEKTRLPARLQANILASNEIRLNISGLNQVSVWLAPGMIDFSKKVKLVLNNRTDVGPMMVQPNLEVLLEDFYYQGDRQRLYLARIDYPQSK